MYCRKCGKIIIEDSEFCKYCGTNVIDNVLEELSENEVNIKTIINDNSKVKINKFDSNNTNISTNYQSKKYFKYLFSIIMIILIIVALTLYFTRKTPTEKIAEKSNSVFLLNVYDEYQELICTGSGFLVFDDMTVVTNYHVIESAYSVEAISEDNNSYNVTELIDYDIQKDIAILKLNNPSGLSVLNIDNTFNSQKGDEVITIGSPLGIKNTVSDGIVSTFIQENGIEYIQFTAPVSKGSSGGPLFNSKGNVIGVTSASYLDGQNINLAIPIKYVTSLKEMDKNISININELNKNDYGTLAYNTGYQQGITKYLGYYFHNYNDKHEIIRVDEKTGVAVSLGICGDYLNLFNDRLYYINNNILYSTNLFGKNTIALTKKNTELTLKKLFVNKYGIFFETNKLLNINSAIYAYNADFSLKKFLNNVGSIIDTKQYTKDNLMFYRDGSLIFINLDSLEEHSSVPMAKNSSNYFLYNNNIIYVTGDATINNLDLNTTKSKIIFQPNNDEVIFILGVYNDYIYYQQIIKDTLPWENGFKSMNAEGKTYRIDIYGLNLMKISDIPMNNLNFIGDKIYFMKNYYDYTSPNKYYKCDLKGSNLTEIK